MEPMITLDFKAKLTIRDVANRFLMIPIERRLPMIDRITKPKTVGDHKVYLSNSIKYLSETELTPDEIGVISNKIRLFKKELDKKHSKLQKEFM